MSRNAQRRLAAAHENRHSRQGTARADRQPRHLHGCQTCRFLGWHGPADLYWCPDTGLLLARSGDLPEDLLALECARARTSRTVVLRVAWIIADRRGLLPEQPRPTGHRARAHVRATGADERRSA